MPNGAASEDAGSSNLDLLILPKKRPKLCSVRWLPAPLTRGIVIGQEGWS